MADSGGSICVLRDENLIGWRVAICGGNGRGTVLQRFSSQSEATQWAMAERDRRHAAGEDKWVVRVNDDCPCRQTRGL